MSFDERIERLRKLNEAVMRDLERMAETDEETAEKLRAIAEVAARDTETLRKLVQGDERPSLLRRGAKRSSRLSR
jgi:hypothetical protein